MDYATVVETYAWDKFQARINGFVLDWPDELKEILQKLTYKELAKSDAEIAQATNEVQQQVPQLAPDRLLSGCSKKNCKKPL